MSLHERRASLLRFALSTNQRRFDRAFIRRLSNMDLVEEETLTSYNPDRYYPVIIGEILQNSYSVKAKLGYGRSSTTWLCRDQSTFKVLKVTTRDSNIKEIDILNHLSHCGTISEHPGKYCVRRLESEFSISTRAGKHQCFVFEPLGPSLLEFTKRATCGSLELDSCNADIKLDNIQLTLPDNEQETLQSLESAEAVKSGPVKQTNHGTPIYKSAEIIQEELGFPILCDFGSAVFTDSVSNGVIQAIPYRAPEVILGGEWSCGVDIWNLGVLIWELLVGERLFGHTDEADSIQRMVQYMGSPPASFLRRCANGGKFFDEQGST
nr:serine/threonine-protein kinase srpk [Quercus suber]